MQAMRRGCGILERTEVDCMAQSVVDRSHIHMPRLRLTSGQRKRPSIVAYRGQIRRRSTACLSGTCEPQSASPKTRRPSLTHSLTAHHTTRRSLRTFYLRSANSKRLLLRHHQLRPLRQLPTTLRQTASQTNNHNQHVALHEQTAGGEVGKSAHPCCR